MTAIQQCERSGYVVWSVPSNPSDFRPGSGEIVFPVAISDYQMDGDVIDVRLSDGTRSRAVWNAKRQRFIIPRRWRKPRRG